MQKYIPTGDLNKTSLAEIVARRAGLTQDQATDAVHAVLDTVAQTLAGGYGVAVTNFGSWHLAVSPARTARNPQTGEAVQVPETFRVKWTTSPKLRDMVNGEVEPSISKAPKTPKGVS